MKTVSLPPSLARRSARLLLAFVSLLAASPALGLTPYLVKDLNPAATAASSEPRNFSTIGRRALFTANEREFWASDGTEAGTVRLLEGVRTSPLASAGGLRFFLAATDELSSDLWVTAGTAASTKRIWSGFRIRLFEGEGPRESLAVPGQRRIYFVGDDGVHGRELWTSDGTTAGTRMVSDIHPGDSFDGPQGFAWFRNRLFFSANDGVRGYTLWTTTGTAASTKNFSTLNASVAAVVGSRLVVTASTVGGGTELWVTDGTSPLVAMPEIVRGRGSPSFLRGSGNQPFQVLANRLIFGAFDGRNSQIWSADPVAKTLQSLRRFGAGRREMFFSSRIGGPLTLLTFSIRDDAHGMEMWRTDGTALGTRLVDDLCPGACDGVGGERGGALGAINGRSLFAASANGVGRDVWSTNGETVERLSFECDSFCSEARPLGRAGSRFLFRAGPAPGGALFSTDGSAAGTLRLRDETAVRESNYSNSAAEVTGQVVFGAFDSEHGMELWRSDGTPSGTRLVADVGPVDEGGSFPKKFRAFGSQSVFVATNPRNQIDVWITDGTDGGTRILHAGEPDDLFGRAFLLDERHTLEAQGLLYFAKEDGSQQLDLWRTDGTPEGTFRLKQHLVDPSRLGESGGPLLASVAGGVVFSAGSDLQSADQEVWFSDGTVDGTRLVVDLVPNGFSSSPSGFTTFENRVYFAARGSGEVGVELWSTDGTAQGTHLVADLRPGPGESSDPQDLVEFRGRLWFLAAATGAGNGLWSTDGTEQGTRFETRIVATPRSFRSLLPPQVVGTKLLLFGIGIQQEIVAVESFPGVVTLLEHVPISFDFTSPGPALSFDGGILFIAGDGASFTRGVWRTNGTAVGTVPLFPGSDAMLSNAGTYEVVGDQVVVIAGDLGGGSGQSLWESDGTAAGTRVLQHLGPRFSGFDLGASGGLVYFTAEDPDVGFELWAVRP